MYDLSKPEPPVGARIIACCKKLIEIYPHDFAAGSQEESDADAQLEEMIKIECGGELRET